MQAAGGDAQTLRGAVRQKAFLPPWLAAAAGGIVLLLCCLLAAGSLLSPPPAFLARPTATPTYTAVTNTPMPTATQSRSTSGRCWWTATGSGIVQ